MGIADAAGSLIGPEHADIAAPVRQLLAALE
jgi:hypothetical protein